MSTTAGTSALWSDVPSRPRQRWGTAIPRNEIGPQKAVTTAPNTGLLSCAQCGHPRRGMLARGGNAGQSARITTPQIAVSTPQVNTKACALA